MTKTMSNGKKINDKREEIVLQSTVAFQSSCDRKSFQVVVRQHFEINVLTAEICHLLCNICIAE